MEKVAEGTAVDLISGFDQQFQPGEKGELRLFLRMEVPDWATSSLQSELEGRGVPLWDNVRQSARTLFIRFSQRSPVLGWIVAGLIAIGLAILIIIGWQLFKVGRALGIPDWALWAGVGAGVYFLMKTLASPTKRVARGYVRRYLPGGG